MASWCKRGRLHALLSAGILGGMLFSSCTSLVQFPGGSVDVSADGVFVNFPGGEVRVTEDDVFVDVPGFEGHFPGDDCGCW